MIQETFTYEDENIVLERNIITDDQTIQLAAMGCLSIGNKTWFRKKRYDSRIDAEKYLQKDEIIAESRTAVFILTPDQKKGETIQPALQFSTPENIHTIPTANVAPTVISELDATLQEIEARKNKPYKFS